jgi:hypothetical protein
MHFACNLRFQVKHGTEDVKEKGSDVAASAERAAHKASVKVSDSVVV